MRLKSEIDIAFALVRNAIDGTVPEVEHMDAHNWWHLFRLMQQNHVSALIFEALPREDVPRDVLIPWLAEHEKVVARYRHQCDVQQQLLDLMSAHGIETLVLKGTHLAQYYPRPELREFGDLDLYFYDRHAKADEVARRELHVEVDKHAHHHTRYELRGVTVESHYDFLNTHYPPSNRRYEALLKELSTLHSPLSTFEVLFILRHMACHFAASRITLRDLVDWTLTCRALQDKVDWGKVKTVVKDFGMEPFVAALNAIAARRLGLTSPFASSPSSGLPSQATVEAVERDLIYGSRHSDDIGPDGIARLPWKLRRWHAHRWKRRMVFSDSEPRLLLANLTSHAEKPASILHKM